MENSFFKSMNNSNSFQDNFDLLMKGLDKSKNRLVTITDVKGNVRRVWKHIESGDEKSAGVNAGKTYEKTGQRHTEHSGFKSGDKVKFMVNGEEVSGVFRHVNQSKHSTVAVVRGDDGKLYERGMSKIKRTEKAKQGDTRGQILENLQGAKRSQDSVSIRFHERQLQNFDNQNVGEQSKSIPESIISASKTAAKVVNKLRKQKNKDSKTESEEVEISKDTEKYNKVYSEIAEVENELDKKYEYPGLSKKVSEPLEKRLKVLKIQENTLARKIDKWQYEAHIAPIQGQSWEDFKDAYSIKEEQKSLRIETTKTAKNSPIGKGSNGSVGFNTESNKTSYNRGDSVSFKKEGVTKTGRVMKVDDNFTHVRLSSGVVEMVSNKNIKN